MTRELKTRDELRGLLRTAVIADPAPDLIGMLGQLGALEIHAHPLLLQHVDSISWTCSCGGVSPAMKAALQRHAPGLQAEYDLRSDGREG
jgi:hypothetical protein